MRGVPGRDLRSRVSRTAARIRGGARDRHRVHPQGDARLPSAGGVPAQAHIKSLDEYEALYDRSVEDPEGFWAEQAESLAWSRQWDQVLDWKAPFAKWFVGGKLNVSRQLPRPPPRHLAQEQGRDHLGRRARRRRARSPTSSCTARSAGSPTCSRRSASQKGDRVAIYMPMIPEAAIAMLACARIGATHTVVFGGFSRRGAARPHQRRRGQARSSPPTAAVAAAASCRSRRTSTTRSSGTPTVEHVRRRAAAPASDVAMKAGPRPLVARADGRRVAPICPAEPLDCRAPALHPLHQRHHRQAQGHRAHHRRLPAAARADHEVRLRPARTRTPTGARPTSAGSPGHSYVVYGPLANGATTLMYEGAPNYPGAGPLLGHRSRGTASTIFYTAPTAIRAFMQLGRRSGRAKHDLVEPAPARHGRRADQPRGLDVVPRGDRRRAAARSSTPGGRPRPARS